MEIKQFGLYCIDDKYFNDFKEGNDFKDNKQENRPHYCAFTDSENITWFIPISSKVETYKKKIEMDRKNKKDSLFYLIGKINGEERVFLVGKIFPVTKKYIKRPFTFQNVPYVIENEELIKQIQKRTKKYLALVKNKKLKPNIDILTIKQQLRDAE